MIKEQVKALWKRCFNDSEAFTEMYFRLRYNNEVNVILQNGDNVISALQAIPYPMTFCGSVIRTSYISGACTHPDYRNKGAMRELLSKAMTQMLRNNVPLSTLIPAEPWLFDYYARMGYAPVFRYSEEVVPKQLDFPDNISVKKITDEQDEAYRYLNRKMQERPCCIQHTPADFKVILADLEISRGNLYMATHDNKTVGVAIAYQQESALQIGELLADDKKTERSLLSYMQQDKNPHKTILVTPPTPREKQLVLGMARIVDAKTILQLYAATYPEVQANIELTDPVLTVNNGYYRLYDGRCTFGKESLPECQRLTIGELCEKIFIPLNPYMSLMLN